jgi:hypothetical protein
MNKFKRFEGVTDAVMKSVTSVMRQSSKAAYEEKNQDAQKMAARYESVRPKTDVEKSVRPIERMYAFMKPTKAAPKEETIAERVQMISEQMGTTPKTDKHKKLAAFVHPKDKITHADVLRARGVPAARGGSRGATSEETEQQTEEQIAEEETGEKLWPGTPAWKAKFGTDKERHELKFGKSDAKKLKPYGYRDDPEDSPMSAQTKGRGRPKKVRTNDTGVKEEVESIEELSKTTLASYAKKATSDARLKMATGKDFERIATQSRKPAYKASAATWEKRYKGDARKREAGTMKAIDRLAKEEFHADASVTETEDYLFSQEEIDRLSEIANSFNPQQ